jgi:hypothetical protein
MRRVEVFLKGPEGWMGWRRVLVVRETATEVFLMQPGVGKTLRLPRSTWEEAKPKSIPKEVARVRAQIAQLQAKPPKMQFWARPYFAGVLAYIKDNLVQHRMRAQPWERIR